MKKAIVVLFLVCIMLGMNYVKTEAKSKIEFKNVEDNKVEMLDNDTYRLKTNSKLISKKDKVRVEYVSADEDVATVTEKGVVIPKKEGKVSIKAYLRKKRNGRKVKNSTVTIKFTIVKFVKIKTLNLDKNDKYLFAGSKVKLDVVETPKNNTEDITWSVDNKRVAKINKNGVLTGISAGKVKVTVKVKGRNKKKSKTFTVRNNVVTSLKVGSKKAVVGIGNIYKIPTVTKPVYVTDNRVLYSSENASIASVDANGNIRGIKAGDTKIHVRYSKNINLEAVIEVTVSRSKGKLTKEMLDKMDLKHVRNLMIVAHPDDDVLWGGAHLISEDYLCVCLTNSKDPVRSVDFNEAMDVADVERIQLDYPDNKEDTQNYYWNYDQVAIQNDIRLLMNYKKWNIVVTHNPEGEYGHYHHKRVNKYATDIYKNNPKSMNRFVYFGKYYAPEKLTDEVKKNLPKMNKDLFEIKVKMLEQYESKHWTCFTWLWHMQPYEDWVDYQDWK